MGDNPKEEVIQIFDQIASKASWEALYSGAATRLSYGFVSRHRAVEEMLDPYAGGKVLDIGCGTGDLVPFYMRKEAAYTGVDLSKHMIERSSSMHAGPVRDGKARFELADCEYLPFGPEEFDVVSAVALIEYLPEPARALDEMKRVTKPGGYLLISVPHQSCINFKIRNFLEPVRTCLYPLYAKLKGPSLAALKEVPHRGYDEEELDSLVEGRGFIKVSGRFVNFYLIPHPIDHLAPNLYMRTSEWIDRGRRDRRFRYWGASYLGLYKKIGISKAP